MNLKAKLTLWYVLLAVIIVGSISALYVANNMQQQFEFTLESAEMKSRLASDFVKDTLNSQRDKPEREALRSPQLTLELNELTLGAGPIFDIAVVDPHTDEVLARSFSPDSPNERLGDKAGPYPDFRSLVLDKGWYEKWRVIRGGDRSFYKLDQPLGPSADNPLVIVRVIIAPSLIRTDILNTVTSNARVAVLCVAGAICITFLFSAIAFRPLGRLRHQLERLESGEYEPEKPGSEKPATDELSLMASKVSMLGQRLRGAQFEVSDLRGNIDRLLQDLEDAVFIFNRDRRLVFASGSVERFLGKDRRDMQGQSITEIFPPSATLGLLIAQAFQTGRPVRNRRVPLEAYTNGAGGVAVVLLSVDMLEAVPGAVHAGSGFLVRLRDPEAQRQLGRELQTADRLAAISRVSGGVAHEVKNPLNAILLHVEVAKAKLAKGDTDIGQQMDIISGEILRLDRVVKTFLDFTRPVELNLATVPLQDLMGEIVALARPQAEAAKIRVNVDEQADGVEVRIDRDLFKQAVLNVVVNAMQAMPDGGELRFEAAAFDETAEIRISDTGSGIPADLRDKIFRLYFTTRKEGSGIGLAMTFRIVQLHDGTIDFTSEPGKGTTFQIRLPIAA